MVEGTALEMRRTCKGTVGSNPTLSANKKGPLWARDITIWGKLYSFIGRGRILIAISYRDNQVRAIAGGIIFGTEAVAVVRPSRAQSISNFRSQNYAFAFCGSAGLYQIETCKECKAVKIVFEKR